MARYKVLKGIAYNHAHSFTSLMNYRDGDYLMGHLVRRARDSGEHTLRVDILGDTAAPPALLTPVIRQTIASYNAWFPKHVSRTRTTFIARLGQIIRRVWRTILASTRLQQNVRCSRRGFFDSSLRSHFF